MVGPLFTSETQLSAYVSPIEGYRFTNGPTYVSPIETQIGRFPPFGEGFQAHLKADPPPLIPGKHRREAYFIKKNGLTRFVSIHVYYRGFGEQF